MKILPQLFTALLFFIIFMHLQQDWKTKYTLQSAYFRMDELGPQWSGSLAGDSGKSQNDRGEREMELA